MDTSLISIIIIAIALAMDAFSVSLTKGFTQKNLTKSQYLTSSKLQVLPEVPFIITIRTFLH